jgi:Sigma-70, region 4
LARLATAPGLTLAQEVRLVRILNSFLTISLNPSEELDAKEHTMNPVREFRHFEFREKVIGAVLEILATLPETQRNIFIWSHYRGYQTGEIAEILGWSASCVETTLSGINSTLYKRARALFAEDPQLDTETSRAVTPPEEERHYCLSGSSRGSATWLALRNNSWALRGG